MKSALYGYLATQTGALTLKGILLNFFIALIISAIIYISYRFSFSGAAYSARFNVSLVMLTLVTTLVMGVIGNNISLSLGMVGALSIVRFRTAIKDPRDTAFIFWCIAVGICCGVSEFLLAGIGSVVMFLFLVLFGSVRRNERFLLVIRSAKEQSQEIEKEVMRYFEGNAHLRVLNTNEEDVEYIYELAEKMIITSKEKHGVSIADILHEIKGVRVVNLVTQNDEINR